MTGSCPPVAADVAILTILSTFAFLFLAGIAVSIYRRHWNAKGIERRRRNKLIRANVKLGMTDDAACMFACETRRRESERIVTELREWQA